MFDGTRESAYARLDRKVTTAVEHKAAGVIVCTDALEVRKHVAQSRKRWLETLDRLAAEHEKLKKADNPTLEQTEAQRKQIEEFMRQVDAASKTIEAQYDPLLPLGQLQAGQARQEAPLMQCRRAVLDRAVQAALGSDLAKLEQQIDQGPTPHSRELTGWKAVGKTDIATPKIALKNVAAVLEGQGPLADETIVVGAHYDHWGYGRPGVRNADPKSIYSGADDNASGTAVLIEVARALAQRPEKLARIAGSVIHRSIRKSPAASTRTTTSRATFHHHVPAWQPGGADFACGAATAVRGVGLAGAGIDIVELWGS